MGGGDANMMSAEEHPVSDERIALYRRKAAEAREQAAAATTIKTRASLVSLAESYERLARVVEESERRPPKD
jgi:hypothetical protein